MEWISAGAAVVSVLVAVWAVLLNRRQNDLNRRLLAIEEAREKRHRTAQHSADLVARCRPGRQSSTYNLEVLNRGPAQAEDVRVEVGGLPPGQQNGPEPGFGLAPGSSVTYQLLVSGQDPNEARVHVAWRDNGGDNSYETVVSLTR